MRGFGIFAASAVLVVAFAGNSVSAQTATAPVGKPLALLAGLRPPHQSKHGNRVANAKIAHEKTAAKTRHSHSAAHVRHAATTKLAARHHAHHQEAMTASAFAEEPPPQAAPTPPPPPAPHWTAANATPADDPLPSAADPAAAPAATSPSTSADSATPFSDPSAAKVQTIKITAANPSVLNDSSNAPVSATAARAAVAPAPPSQTVYSAPMPEPAAKTPAAVGSASWIAQVLAALGGAVAAGVVALFLIGGSRPARTYG
jgi:hypothetical protein